MREYTPTKRGAKQERERIRLWQHSALACRSLASITTADLAQWRNKQLAKGRAPSTIRNRLTIISQVYKVAVSEWGCAGLTNPVASLRLPKQRPGRNRRLEGDEKERLLEACEGLPPWLRPLIVVLLETGMRRGEVLGLSAGHISGSLAVLPRTKNGRSRTVPLSSRARAAVVELLPHLPVRATVVEWYWKRALRAARVEGLTMHDL